MALFLFSVIWGVTFVAWILAFRLGLAWAQVKDVKLGRVLLTALAVLVGTKIVNLLFVQQLNKAREWAIVPEEVWPMIGDTLLVALFLATTWVLVSNLFQANWKQTFVASVPTFVPLIVIFVLLKYVAASLLFGTYQVGGCPMAPTLLGTHVQAICEECGARKYCLAPDKHLSEAFFQEQPMICENFHVTIGCLAPEYPLDGDHVFVSNLSEPKRWDIVLFRAPWDSSQRLVMRLVGLPGETISLEEGMVCVDGQVLEVPDHLQGLKYVDHWEDTNQSISFWGSPDRPAQLGENEYFVLGDFSSQAYDSRFWSKALPGHAPYALPRSEIIGVVSEIYWPPTRWRSFP
ncbi:signal peptidase I [Blastopirellula marina]|uniref:Signal peptidase I n=1 Tax=Blastopirellula marina TaxID=124 RepID=A0A2S8FN94_9BACT|nr:signal peptidase I [Blastopirellula marina]PQO33646.1 signal peptidase I [Blastopirellula marina]PTL43433.1 signal peptidase I [Blastopirellula marina]